MKKLTIIIIAHRLTTIEKCDNIFLLDKGEIVNNGKYKRSFQIVNCSRR